MTGPDPVIHVIDDDASFRSSIGRLLEALGYRVTLYESGEQFLRSPLCTDPGCILLDLRMAGLDGLQLQQRLADVQTLLPVVFLTGHGDITASVQAMKSGAEDFLVKPVSKAELLDAIGRAPRAIRPDRTDPPSRGPALAPRAGRLPAVRARQAEQADCPRTGEIRANHQGATPEHHAEARGSFGRRSRFDGREARLVGCDREQPCETGLSLFSRVGPALRRAWTSLVQRRGTFSASRLYIAENNLAASGRRLLLSTIGRQPGSS